MTLAVLVRFYLHTVVRKFAVSIHKSIVISFPVEDKETCLNSFFVCQILLNCLFVATVIFP